MTHKFTSTQVVTLIRGVLPSEGGLRYYLGDAYVDYIVSKYSAPIRKQRQVVGRRGNIQALLHLLDRDFSEMTLHSIATNKSLQCLPNLRSLHYVERSQ